jgi:hypothetical protein
MPLRGKHLEDWYCYNVWSHIIDDCFRSLRHVTLERYVCQWRVWTPSERAPKKNAKLWLSLRSERILMAIDATHILRKHRDLYVLSTILSSSSLGPRSFETLRSPQLPGQTPPKLVNPEESLGYKRRRYSPPAFPAQAAPRIPPLFLFLPPTISLCPPRVSAHDRRSVPLTPPGIPRPPASKYAPPCQPAA